MVGSPANTGGGGFGTTAFFGANVVPGAAFTHGGSPTGDAGRPRGGGTGGFTGGGAFVTGTVGDLDRASATLGATPGPLLAGASVALGTCGPAHFTAGSPRLTWAP